jgi:diacylglycerol O-acyltransferase
MDYEEWMSAADSIMWHIERDPVLRSTITMIWFLDTEPDPDRLDRTLRLTVARIPRLRQRIADDGIGISTPRWIADEDFRLEDHVTEHDLTDGSDAEIFETAGRLHTEPFDRDRPLWEVHVFHGLAGDRAAVVCKLHHGIADGMGLVRMTGALIQKERDSPIPDPDAEVVPIAPAPRRPHVVDAVARRVTSDARLAGQVGAAATRTAAAIVGNRGRAREVQATASSVGRMLAPARTPLSPLMTERSQRYRLTWLEVPLAEMKQTAARLGASLNDLFVAGAIGGIDRYHDTHDAEAHQLRVTMPISIRPADDATAGNQFVPSRFVVDAGIHDPAERLRRYRDALAEVRAEPGMSVFSQVSEVIDRLGPRLATGVVSGMMKAVDLTVSNVPGPRHTNYFAGARVDRVVPYGPCAGSAVNITLYSYDGVCTIGITSDEAAVPDPDVLTRCVDEGLREVLDLVAT